MDTNHNDTLHHFVFENTPIRGNLVHLNRTFLDVLQHQDLPLVIKNALGELMAASALLSSTLKMDGVLIIQIQTKGALKLLVVECSSNFEIRATAKWDGDLADDFISMIHDGQCVITLDQKNGEPYQGIVPIEGDTIAQILENYMLRSQQIDTKLWLTCDSKSASGMLLQKLPEQPGEGLEYDEDIWNRVGILADTVTTEELQALAPELLLTRLFGEETVRLFTAKSTQFYCGCNRTKVANMLHMLGKPEIESIIAERDGIDVNCEFCNKHYQFDAIDAAAIFVKEALISPSKSTH